MKLSVTAIALLTGVSFASAQAPAALAEGTATPPRLVAVQGVANVPISQHASLTEADAAYRQALAAALSDGQGKAEYLASKLGASLGQVQSIGEEGGSISCSGGEPEASAEYEGAQPDFGYAELRTPLVSAGTATPITVPARSAPTSNRRKTSKVKRQRHRKGHHAVKRARHPARKADAVTCTLSAGVSLSWALA